MRSSSRLEKGPILADTSKSGARTPPVVSPPRPTHTRASRAADARRLKAQGLTRKEIAKKLGISVGYVNDVFYDPDGTKLLERRERYRRPCPKCGALMSGQAGFGPKSPKLCHACAVEKQKAKKKWTRERIIEAIQLFERRNGRPPLATEWFQPTSVRGEDYPPGSSIYRSKLRGKMTNQPFASWAEAIEAAGFPRPHVGRKVSHRGQGMSRTENEWIVFIKEDDGRWSLHETTAINPDHAVEKVAFKEGEYFPVRKAVFFVRKFTPKEKNIYTLLGSTPGGHES